HRARGHALGRRGITGRARVRRARARRNSFAAPGHVSRPDAATPPAPADRGGAVRRAHHAPGARPRRGGRARPAPGRGRRAFGDRVAEGTAGTPYCLGEVLRALKEEGRLGASLPSAAPLPLPETVRESIRRRLEPLPAAERDLLSLAAVAGQEFDVPVLQLAAG